MWKEPDKKIFISSTVFLLHYWAFDHLPLSLFKILSSLPFAEQTGTFCKNESVDFMLEGCVKTVKVLIEEQKGIQME